MWQNLSVEEKRDCINNNSLNDFLKEKKKYNYLDSVSEKNSKKYFQILKGMDRKNEGIENMKTIYKIYGLNNKNDVKQSFKQMESLNSKMKNNEKKLIKALLSKNNGF